MMIMMFNFKVMVVQCGSNNEVDDNEGDCKQRNNDLSYNHGNPDLSLSTELVLHPTSKIMFCFEIKER